jgi:hypothetical protein
MLGDKMEMMSERTQTQEDAAAAAFTRHKQYFDHYLAWLSELERPNSADTHVCVMARSPSSPVIRALIDRAEQLRLQNVRAKAILAHLEPASALRELVETLARIAGEPGTGNFIRWFAGTSLLDAHEQLVLGSSMCWTGDTMKREPGKCDALDLFEQAAPVRVLYGVSSFARVWPICSELSRKSVRKGIVSVAAAPQAARSDRGRADFTFQRRVDHSAQTRH